VGGGVGVGGGGGRASTADRKTYAALSWAWNKAMRPQHLELERHHHGVVAGNHGNRWVHIRYKRESQRG